MTASFDGLHRAVTQSQAAAVRTPLRRQHRFDGSVTRRARIRQPVRV